MSIELIFSALVLVKVMILIENRLTWILRLCTLDAVLLAFAELTSTGDEERTFHRWTLVGLILIFKAVMTPWVLTWSSRRIRSLENTESRIGVIPVMVFLILGASASYAVSAGFVAHGVTFSRVAITQAIMMIYIGLLTLILRTHWIPLVVGFVLFENGVFALTMLLRTELPLGIEFGTFADAVLVVVAAAVIQLLDRNTPDTKPEARP